jgi:hypothetical protein
MVVYLTLQIMLSMYTVYARRFGGEVSAYCLSTLWRTRVHLTWQY